MSKPVVQCDECAQWFDPSWVRTCDVEPAINGVRIGRTVTQDMCETCARTFAVYRTADRGIAHVGDRVFNYYDRQWGKITNGAGRYDDGWFDFLPDGESLVKSLNGERIALRDPDPDVPAAHRYDPRCPHVSTYVDGRTQELHCARCHRIV